MNERTEMSFRVWSSFIVSEMAFMILQSFIFPLVIAGTLICSCLRVDFSLSYQIFIIIIDVLIFATFCFAIFYSKKRYFPNLRLYVLLRIINIVVSAVLLGIFLSVIRNKILSLTDYILTYSLILCFLIPLLALIVLIKGNNTN
ncbi:MAG: hypothetical protein ACTSVO_00100 [Candidatus Heimdallarchaeaceae archaeon]